MEATLRIWHPVRTLPPIPCRQKQSRHLQLLVMAVLKVFVQLKSLLRNVLLWRIS